jgi:hypothetical protein
MTGISRDDIRAAVGAGMLNEAQAASLIALSQTRSGVRQHMSGLDEPFELFRGFNEVFIIVGLVILFSGWLGLTGATLTSFTSNGSTLTAIYAVVAIAAIFLLARYFTLKRRMVGPSIALAIFFAQAAGQLGAALGWMMRANLPEWLTMAAGTATVLLCVYYLLFRVPFTVALIAGGVFLTAFGLVSIGGTLPEDPADMFLLTNDGPFAILTMALGLVGLTIAMWFDMSDPHRITRRAASGFWLHIVAAPAIVNTVALTLFEVGTLPAQLSLIAFVTLMALFAVVIDRRSFLVSAVGYIVALSVTVIEDQAFIAILLLGIGLVLLGAKWEAIRRALMTILPAFPGKTRLPPWKLLPLEEPAP